MIRLDLAILLMALAVSVLGFVPLFPFLETFPKLFLPGAILVRLLAERRRFKLDPRIVTAGSVAVFLAYLSQVSRADIVGPVVNLLVVLLGVRFLGERSARNYLQLFLLALFCLAASSLYSLDALFMVYLGLQLVLFEIALVLLACYDRDPATRLTRQRFRSLVSVPLAMLAVSIPLLLCFFVILPRTQFPLWEFLANPSGKKTGFAETVQPGNAAAISDAKAVAFRAECGKLSPAELYWRGIVLNHFDGTAWSRRPPPAGERFAPGKGRLVPQKLFLEPGTSRYLVALDLPVQVSGVRGLATSPDFTLSRSNPYGRRSTYEVGSAVAGKSRGRLGDERGFYQEVPQQLPAWFRETGARLGTAGGTGTGRLAAVEKFFLGQELVYATTGLPLSKEPLVEFLTVKKRGNCEFFASSCALLLRLAGIPARLVGGYLGGEYNDLGGYYVVTEDRAHVWVEAYLDGDGWVRLDPSRWAVNAGEVGAPSRPGGLRALLLAVDTVTYFWNRQVITYDLERQISLFNEAGRRLNAAGPLRTGWLPGVAAMIALPFFAFLVWWGARSWQNRPSLERRLVEAFIELFRQRYGGEATPDQGLRELTAGVQNPDVERFVKIYSGAVYRDRRLSPEESGELRSIIRRMKQGDTGTVREKPHPAP